MARDVRYVQARALGDDVAGKDAAQHVVDSINRGAAVLLDLKDYIDTQVLPVLQAGPPDPEISARWNGAPAIYADLLGSYTWMVIKAYDDAKANGGVIQLQYPTAFIEDLGRLAGDGKAQGSGALLRAVQGIRDRLTRENGLASGQMLSQISTDQFRAIGRTQIQHALPQDVVQQNGLGFPLVLVVILVVAICAMIATWKISSAVVAHADALNAKTENASKILSDTTTTPGQKVALLKSLDAAQNSPKDGSGFPGLPDAGNLVMLIGLGIAAVVLLPPLLRIVGEGRSGGAAAAGKRLRSEASEGYRKGREFARGALGAAPRDRSGRFPPRHGFGTCMPGEC